MVDWPLLALAGRSRSLTTINGDFEQETGRSDATLFDRRYGLESILRGRKLLERSHVF
jgi:hypothetical protein